MRNCTELLLLTICNAASFRGLDLSQHTSKITVDSPDSSSWSLLSKSSKLSKASIPREEIEFPFLIAQVDYSPEECPEHLNFLRNIYKVGTNYTVENAIPLCFIFEMK